MKKSGVTIELEEDVEDGPRVYLSSMTGDLAGLTLEETHALTCELRNLLFTLALTSIEEDVGTCCLPDGEEESYLPLRVLKLCRDDTA